MMTQSHDCSGEEERSTLWLQTCPEQPCLEPPSLPCGKQQSVVCFMFSYKKARYRASTVWMLVYIQRDSHLLVLLAQTPEKKLTSSLQKVTCASVLQLWKASFPAQAFRITVRLGAFSRGGRERGSYMFIQVSVKSPLTCDTMQGLLALPAG